MTAAARADDRRAMVAKIKIAQKDLALDDGTYRALLARVTGKTSAAQMALGELHDVLTEFARLGWKAKPRSGRAGAGRRPCDRRPAEGPLAAKLRALWISGYWLGVIEDASERAMARWAWRLTGGESKGGVAALQWLDGDGFNKAIEGLKALLAREGRVRWQPYYLPGGPFHNPRARVLEAQWLRLAELRVVPIAGSAALDRWIAGRPGLPADADRFSLTPAQADQAIRELGRMLRPALGKSLPEER